MSNGSAPAQTLEQANEEIAKLKDQVSRLGKALGELGGNVSQVSVGTTKLLGPFSSLFDATARGATGLSAYNTTLDMSKAMFDSLIGTGSILSTALSGMSEAAKTYIKMAGAQADALMQSYQGLASVGAAGKADLVDVYETMSKFGVTSREELPKFTQMLTQSSEMLAKMGGTVAQGMKQFADVSASIQQTGLQTEFMNMGMSVDSINKSIAGYLKIQTQSGAAQKMTQEQMNAGAAEYIRNMDVLSKLTGKSAEALGKEREERLNDEKYLLMRRQQQQVVARGGAEGAAMAKTIEQQEALLSMIKTQYGDETAKAAQRAMGPYGAQTEEGLKLLRSLPETYKLIADMNRGGTATKEEIAEVMAKESTKNIETMGGLVQASGTTGGLNMVELIRGESARAGREKTNAEIVAAGGTAKTATQTAKDQQTAQTETPDSSVAAMTALVQQQRQATKAVSDMTTEGIKPATEMMQFLADKAREFAKILPGAKEISQRQQEEQAAYKEPGGAVKSGGSVGNINDARMRTGISPATIETAAMDQTAKVKGQVEDSADKLKAKGVEGLDELKKMLADLISGRPTPPVVTPPVVTPPNNRPPRVGAAGDTTETLAINRGYVNIASAENIRFPAMPTAYQSSLDPDMTSRVRGFSESDSANKESKSELAGVFDDGFRMLSRDLTAQTASIDELVDLMRRGVGYQRKISMSASA